MKYWTYILETEKGTLYTGVAIDVEKRFQEHLDGSSKGKKGAKYTNSNKPVKIVYKKQFDSKSLAMKEEWRIKHLKREEKLKLIENENN
ncbi:GIY-YIG nuclease family protein [bacterium]|nr:GIY-YIG nuclease family protein [bacterium]